MGGIEPPGARVLLEDEHKGVLKALALHPAAGLLKQQPAVALPPLRRVGVEGGDLPPVGVGPVVEFAEIPGVVVHHPGLAVVQAGHRRISPVEQQAVDAVLALVILPEHLHPAVIGDLPGHVIGGHRFRVRVPPPQGVYQGHGLEMLLCTGVHKAQLVHKNLPK